MLTFTVGRWPIVLRVWAQDEAVDRDEDDLDRDATEEEDSSLEACVANQEEEEEEEEEEAGGGRAFVAVVSAAASAVDEEAEESRAVMPLRSPVSVVSDGADIELINRESVVALASSSEC